MTLTLSRRGEQLIAEYLRSGRYSSAEEVVAKALEILAEKEGASEQIEPLTPAEAVADIREMRRGVTLGGLAIQDLIREGRKH